jgi:PrtD family type I secretion system ABC transporter
MKVAILHRPKETPRAMSRGVPHLIGDSGNSKRPSVSSAIGACRSALLGTAGISLVTNLLMLTGPLFMLQIYDRVLASGSVETLVALLVLVTGLFTFMGLLELVRARVLVRIGLRLDRLIGKVLFESVLQVTPAVGGAHQTQALRDLEQIRQFAGGPVPSAAFDAPWVPIYFAVLFLFHSLLGVVALVGALVLVVLSVINEALSRRPLQEVNTLSARSMEFAEAGRRNAETLHAMGMTAVYCNKWLDQHHQILSKHLQASDVAGTLTVSTRIIRLFLQSLVLAVGAYLAIQQAITPGLMVAASIIMARALAPIEQLVGQWRSILAVRQATLRVEKQLQQMPQVVQRITLPPMRGSLAVSDLYAAPMGSQEIVLKGVNFSLEPGQAVGVIGPSASGKSTLARALVGVWPVKRGEIRLDGAALNQWDKNQLGRKIGYLPQDIELFDGTIADNIARFDPRCGEQHILLAAQRANVHELILRLPQGYETRVGEAGAVLSGGQRQRVALARALCGDPAFIVLDEPNSNLDSEGEQALCNVIRELRREGRTIVVMAHRASVIGAVDHLLVLRDGRQISFGPRDEVLRKYIVTDSARSDHDKN